MTCVCKEYEDKTKIGVVPLVEGVHWGGIFPYGNMEGDDEIFETCCSETYSNELTKFS